MQRIVRFSLALVALACSAVAAAPIDYKNPAEGRFSDQWLEIYLNGAKVGYGHTTMAREGKLIHTSTTMHMRIERAAQQVKISMAQRTTETLEGVPVSFGSEMDASVMKTTTRGTVKGGRVTIVTSQFGMEQTQTFDFAAGALMSWGLYRESIIRGFKPGTEYTTQTYTPELRLDGPISTLTKIGEWEEFDYRGEQRRGQKVTMILEAPGGTMETVAWLDEDRLPLKAKVPAPGMGDMVIVTTDQATAVADFLPPELFLTTVIKANAKLDRANVQRIKYRITSTSGDADLGELPNTDMQAITSKGEGSIDLLVTRQEHKTAPKANTQKPSAELNQYLDANLMINTADPELIKLAKRAGGDETEPYALADKLRRFVTDYITDKNLSVGFATASEVCRTKEGDCSEHAVLLAALGRIKGLPSRVAAGVAYVPIFGKQQDIFGYHMWTQFHINGEWIDVDAALRETVCSPARIVFAISSLKNAGLADLSLPLITKIGAIDIDILEIDGKQVQPAKTE